MFGTSFGNSASSGGAFAPSDIDGLRLWLDADAANVNTEAAADFVSSNSEYLSSVSTAFNKGNESFSFGGWVKFDNVATQQSIIGKWGNGTSRKSYLLWNSGGSISAILSNDGGDNSSTVSTAVSISSSVWYFCVVVYDSVNNLFKISVNAETFVTATDSIGPYNPDSPYQLDFARLEGGYYGNQQQDLAFFYDKALSQSEVTALYNSGNATAYSSLSAAQKTNLVSWWSLSETSGIRYDQHGTNNLTDNGSVGWAAGILNEPVVNDSPVSRWLNKGTGTLNGTQSTAIAQPIWKSSGFGTNSKPYLVFDGDDDFLTLGTEYSKLPNHTVFAVYQIDATINSSTRQTVIGDLNTGGQTATGSIAVVFRDGSFETSFGETEDATRITQRQATIDTVSSTTYITTLKYTSGDSLQTVLRNNSTLSLPTVLGTATSIGGTAYEMRVGQWGEGGFWPLDGKVAEILIYSAALTASEVESVNDYLNTKYAAY